MSTSVNSLFNHTKQSTWVYFSLQMTSQIRNLLKELRELDFKNVILATAEY
jgi:hypothetical protein